MLTNLNGKHPATLAEARKEAIVEAVQDVFAEKGFEGTTTRDLAKAAGVSEALLYKHFPSKESLYRGHARWLRKGADFRGGEPDFGPRSVHFNLGGDGPFHDLALRAGASWRYAPGCVEFFIST